MRNNPVFCGLCAAVGLVVVGCAADAEEAEMEAEAVAESVQELACATSVPASLRVPDAKHPDFTLSARGAQVYTCKQTDAEHQAWTFVAPDARLFVAHQRRPAGHHYAGPTWKANDGSSVVASVVASATPDAHAIPWLLLRATTHDGSGLMSGVRYIQRLSTTGGLSPTAGCDAAHVGATVDVPYTATYAFFR